MKLILIIVFAVFAYVNYRHLNIGFLSLVEIDEYAFHHSLINMFEGVIELNLKKLNDCRQCFNDSCERGVFFDKIL